MRNNTKRTVENGNNVTTYQRLVNDNKWHTDNIKEERCKGRTTSRVDQIICFKELKLGKLESFSCYVDNSSQSITREIEGVCISSSCD